MDQIQVSCLQCQSLILKELIKAGKVDIYTKKWYYIRVVISDYDGIFDIVGERERAKTIKNKADETVSIEHFHSPYFGLFL